MNPTLHDAALWFAEHPFVLGLAKGALLLVLAALLSAALAKSRLSAAARHAVLASGLVCALLIPCLSFVPAGLSFRWQIPAAAEIAAPPPAAAVVEKAVPAGPSAASPALETSARRAQAGWGTVLGRVPAVPWFAAFWALGVLVVAGIILAGHVRLRLSARRMQPVRDARMLRFFEAECARQKTRASLWTATDETLAPAAFGAFAPARVILPASATAWSGTNLRAVLAHELAHVARCDWPMKLLAQALVALYWFHPCAWWVARRMEEEAECACDDRVVAGGAASCDYADCMFQLARTLRASPTPAWSRASTPFHSFLQRRIAMLLEPSRNRRPLGATSVLLCAFLAACVGIGAGLCACQAQQPASAKGTEPGGKTTVHGSDGYAASVRFEYADGEKEAKTVLCKGKDIVHTFPGAAAASFSPDGRYLLLQEQAADDDCQWFVWNLKESLRSGKMGGRFAASAQWSKDSKSIHFIANPELGKDSSYVMDKIAWRTEAYSDDDCIEENPKLMEEYLKHAKQNPIPPEFGEAVATISEVGELEPGRYGYAIAYQANGRAYAQNVISSKKPVEGQKIRIRYEKDEPILYVELDEIKLEK